MKLTGPERAVLDVIHQAGGEVAEAELRKLCIDAVYRALGAEAAVQISGDNIATVLKYYADPNRGREAVDVASMIVGG